MICVWVPLHVWSVMLANREDYLSGGVKYFPVSREFANAVPALVLLSLPLFAVSLALYFTSGMGLIYLTSASLLGALMVYANARLLTSGASRDAWKVYKLSAFPYLGLIFLAMSLDVWLLA